MTRSFSSVACQITWRTSELIKWQQEIGSASHQSYPATRFSRAVSNNNHRPGLEPVER